jgi:sugar phosphate isomerase/epimerase
MALLSINETTTYRWSFEEDVLQYVAAGIPSLGAWRQKLSDYGEVKAAELLAETGIRVSHLFWAGGFTGSDGRSFRAGIDDATEALRTAGEIRAETLIVYSGARASHTFNHAKRLLRDALRELAPKAEECGVTLAIEPVHPRCAREFTFLHSVDDTLAMLDAVGDPRIRMIFDTYHLGLGEDVCEGLLARIPQIVDRIALVQLGDAKAPPDGEPNRCRLGDGVVPLGPIVHALAAAGYDGYYDVELLGEEIEPIDYRQLLEHSKAAFEGLLAPVRSE